MADSSWLPAHCSTVIFIFESIEIVLYSRRRHGSRQGYANQCSYVINAYFIICLQTQWRRRCSISLPLSRGHSPTHTASQCPSPTKKYASELLMRSLISIRRYKYRQAPTAASESTWMGLAVDKAEDRSITPQDGRQWMHQIQSQVPVVAFATLSREYIYERDEPTNERRRHWRPHSERILLWRNAQWSRIAERVMEV